LQIQRVKIENYRSIQIAEFSPSPLCALIGGNNCGKSNVLKAINLVLGDRWPSVRAIEDWDFHGYEENKDIVVSVWFDEVREVRGDIGNPTPFSGVQFKATRYKRNSGAHRKGDLRGEFVCIDDQGQAVQVLRRGPGGAKAFPQPARVSEEIRSGLPAVMVDVDRNAKHHLSGNQWSILGRMLLSVSKDMKSDQARYSNFKEKFQEARELLRTDDFIRLQNLIVQNLEAHTGIKGVDIILDDIDPINLYKSLSVLFRDPETPHPVDAERMGSGIQSAVVISLLQAYRELHKENAVLLFEEPELFLHPHGRRHLCRLLCELAQSGTQVIYTTHSQDFVDLARLDCVQIVTKTRDLGTKLKPPAEAALTNDWKAKLKLIRHFSSPRNEVFFADSVVLVEGITELAVISHLTAICEPPIDLDGCNCSIIEVGGKPAMPLFIRMMHALGKRVLAVYDSDSDNTKPEAVAHNAKCSEDISEALGTSSRSFVCDPYLEQICGCNGTGKRDKEEKMREHLSTITLWEKVPAPIQGLMNEIRKLATPIPTPALEEAEST
jgi:putative ATP-dependent endonuclease of OLD family